MKGELRDFLRLFLGFGMLMVICGAGYVLTQPSDSPEYVISICNMMIGVLLIGSVFIFLRIFGGYGKT